jgi:hypothetical protein
VIDLPAGTRIWIAAGVTDMRRAGLTTTNRHSWPPDQSTAQRNLSMRPKWDAYNETRTRSGGDQTSKDIVN